MLGAIDQLGGVDLSQVAATIGPRSFTRGRGYARGNRVLATRWDADLLTLTGSVVGRGALYDTVAFFAASTGGPPSFDDGECNCPVGYNCKHVAALVIAAVEGPGGHVRTEPGTPRPAPPVEQPSWDEPLRALVQAPAHGASGIPLAVELSLRPAGKNPGSRPRLVAALRRPGARGRWIKASLIWSTLDSWQARSGEYRAEHVTVLRELHAIQHASNTRPVYGYGYGAEKDLEIDACDSVQLWSLLERAEKPQAEILVAIVPSIKKLVDAASAIP